MKIERATAADYPEILALNESGLPHVNRISADDLAAICRAVLLLPNRARGRETLAGFLLAFSQGRPITARTSSGFGTAIRASSTSIGSSSRHPRRRSGIGRSMRISIAKSAHAPDLTCEVNLDPPNRDHSCFTSDRILRSRRQHTDLGAKLVCLMSKDLSATVTNRCGVLFSAFRESDQLLRLVVCREPLLPNSRQALLRASE